MRSHLNSLAVFHIQIVWKISLNIRADFKLPQETGLQDSSVYNFYSACSSMKMKLTTAVESILTAHYSSSLHKYSNIWKSVLSYLFHGVTTTNPMIKRKKKNLQLLKFHFMWERGLLHMIYKRDFNFDCHNFKNMGCLKWNIFNISC